MLNGFHSSQEDRLRRAEEARAELMRLQPIAADAARLRLETAKAELQVARDSAMSQAQAAVSAASERQVNVPSLLSDACRAVSELNRALREIDTYRKDALKALAIADRVDYEIEAGEHEAFMGGDPKALAYALTATHGKSHIKQTLEEMDPGFCLLRGCNLDGPLFQDVANFVVEHAVGSRHSGTRTPTIGAGMHKARSGTPN